MIKSVVQNFTGGHEMSMDLSANVSSETMREIMKLVSREFKPEKELVDLHNEIDHICDSCADTTCIYWKDGTKTSVECQEDDDYKRELGIVWAIAEKAMGGKKNLHDLLEQYPEDDEDEFDDFDDEEDFEEDFDIEEIKIGGFGSGLPIEVLIGMLPFILGGRR